MYSGCYDTELSLANKVVTVQSRGMDEIGGVQAMVDIALLESSGHMNWGVQVSFVVSLAWPLFVSVQLRVFFSAVLMLISPKKCRFALP